MIAKAAVRLWVSFLGALVIAAALFLPLGKLTDDRLVSGVFDFLHFPLFAIVTFFLHGLCSSRLKRSGRMFAVLCVVLAALVLVVEVLQPLLGRSFSVTDLLMGFGGILAAAIFLKIGRRRFVARLSAIGLLAVALIPLANIIIDRARAHRAFPVLADFESALEFDRWHTADCTLSLDQDHVTSGEHAVRVAFYEGEGAYDGLFLYDMVRDWVDMEQLCLDLIWPGAEGRILWLRIDDIADQPPYDERFQKCFELNAGTNRICIHRSDLVTPSGRPLDLGGITRCGLFMKVPTGETMFVDHVRLILKGRP